MLKREFTLKNQHAYAVSTPVKWIVSHVSRYPLLPLGLILMAIVNNAAFGTVQLYIGRAFDIISSASWELSALTTVMIALGVVAVSQGLTGLIRSFSTEFLAQRVERDSRDELYASLLGKSQTFHGRQRIGDIMARATNDVRMLSMMFSPGVMLITDSFMSLVVPVIMIGIINVNLLLVPGIFTVLLVITVADYNKRLKPVSFDQREAYGTMNAGLAEAVEGIEVVKGNAREEFELNRFSTGATAFRNFFVRQGEIQAMYFPLLAFSVCWAFAFLHGIILWRNGSLSMGQVVAFLGLMGTLRFPTFISIFAFNLVQLGMASAGRILHMINETTELDENVHGLQRDVKGRVEFKDVDFSYDGNAILSGISFVAEPGETVAIVGQTGSGKTTLSRLVNRIFDTDAGEVSVDGIDVKDWNLASLRSQISTIEQDVFLFSRSIRDNIAFGHAEASDELVRKAAEEAQAHEFIMSFPDGYETSVGERGVTLSGGQRQRIAIARAFLTDPKILILDDSTSAIDSATEDLIQRAMRKISSERTTFIITHRLSQIRWADRILVLKRGRLADSGTHEELLQRSDDYRKIFIHYE